MEFIKSDTSNILSSKYDTQFVNENLMGPNALKIMEELTSKLDLRPSMKVLDLGCGTGLTSIFLAKEFGVQVYATDLWIGATENFIRFKDMGLDNLITPLHADAQDLPFADEYFDAIVSVDAYQYFGGETTFMDDKLAPLVKPEGVIALAVPGFKKDIHDNLPPEFFLSWKAEDLDTFHSCEWWGKLLAQATKINIQSITEMECFEASWKDWLSCDSSNPFYEHAANDRKSMEAGAGKYMNLVSIIAYRKNREKCDV